MNYLLQKLWQLFKREDVLVEQPELAHWDLRESAVCALTKGQMKGMTWISSLQVRENLARAVAINLDRLDYIVYDPCNDAFRVWLFGAQEEYMVRRRDTRFHESVLEALIRCEELDRQMDRVIAANERAETLGKDHAIDGEESGDA